MSEAETDASIAANWTAFANKGQNAVTASEVEAQIESDLNSFPRLSNALNSGTTQFAPTVANPNHLHYNWRAMIDVYGHLRLNYAGVQDYLPRTQNRIFLDSDTGDIWAKGVNINSSDDRFKINERPITGAIDTLMNLQFFEYEKIQELGDTEGTTERGVIAQQLQGTELDFAVRGDEQHQLYVTYHNVHMTVAQAVKDLVAEVRELQTRVASLEAWRQA